MPRILGGQATGIAHRHARHRWVDHNRRAGSGCADRNVTGHQNKAKKTVQQGTTNKALKSCFETSKKFFCHPVINQQCPSQRLSRSKSATCRPRRGARLSLPKSAKAPSGAQLARLSSARARRAWATAARALARSELLAPKKNFFSLPFASLPFSPTLFLCCHR
jgi:hypothetical protein